MFGLHHLFGQANNLSDQTRLDFHAKEGSWIFSPNQLWVNALSDTTIIKNGEHPTVLYLIKIRNNERVKKNNSLSFLSFTNGLIVNPSVKDSLTISLSYKSNNLAMCLFLIEGMDQKGQTVCTNTINMVDTADWAVIKTTQSLNEVSFLRFTFHAYPDCNKTANCMLWLDKIKLTSNGTAPGNLVSKTIDGSFKINKKEIVPLSLSNEKQYSQIPEFSRKIVALGQSIEGSQTIEDAAIDIMKYRISNRNCKLIILDATLAEMLSCNRYVQGDDRFNLDRIFQQDLLNVTTQSKKMIGFLEWLKEYNKTTDKKVWLLGADAKAEDSLTDYVHLFNYFRTLDNLESDELSDEKLANTLFSDVNMINTLRSMDKREKKPNTLIEYSIIERDFQLAYAINTSLSLINKDSIKYENIKFFTDLICPSTETVTIYSKLKSTCYNPSRTNLPTISYSCSDLLKQNFTDNYSSVAFFVNKGKRTVLKNMFGNFSSEKLISPYENSLEFKLGKIGRKNFYIDASPIAHRPMYMRVGGLSKNQFFIGYPNSLMDGIIYLDQSKPLKMIRPKMPFQERMKIQHEQINRFLNLLTPTDIETGIVVFDDK